MSSLKQRPHQRCFTNTISHRHLKNVIFLLVTKKANLITCQITARCVRHLSRGRPFYRPRQPSSGCCTRTGHTPLLRGCTKNTQSLCLIKSSSPKLSQMCLFILFAWLFRWCTGAEWTSHWAWERSTEFPRAPKTATPPTGCAHRPGSSSQPRPTGSTHPRGSRWQTACLRREEAHARQLQVHLKPRGGVIERSFFNFCGYWLTDRWH